MDSQQLIEKKVREHYPMHVKIIGEEALESYIEMKLKGEDPDVFSEGKGKKFDLTSIWEVIETVVNAAASIVALIQYLESKKEKTEKKKLIEEAKKQAKIETNEYDEYLSQIFDEHVSK